MIKNVEILRIFWGKNKKTFSILLTGFPINSPLLLPSVPNLPLKMGKEEGGKIAGKRGHPTMQIVIFPGKFYGHVNPTNLRVVGVSYK